MASLYTIKLRWWYLFGDVINKFRTKPGIPAGSADMENEAEAYREATKWNFIAAFHLLSLEIAAQHLPLF